MNPEWITKFSIAIKMLRNLKNKNYNTTMECLRIKAN